MKRPQSDSSILSTRPACCSLISCQRVRSQTRFCCPYYQMLGRVRWDRASGSLWTRLIYHRDPLHRLARWLNVHREPKCEQWLISTKRTHTYHDAESKRTVTPLHVQWRQRSPCLHITFFRISYISSSLTSFLTFPSRATLNRWCVLLYTCLRSNVQETPPSSPGSALMWYITPPFSPVFGFFGRNSMDEWHLAPSVASACGYRAMYRRGLFLSSKGIFVGSLGTVKALVFLDENKLISLPLHLYPSSQHWLQWKMHGALSWRFVCYKTSDTRPIARIRLHSNHAVIIVISHICVIDIWIFLERVQLL